MSDLSSRLSAYATRLRERGDERTMEAALIEEAVTALAEDSRLREALEYIAGRDGGCTNYIGPSSCLTAKSRKRDGLYQVDQWCGACIARDALSTASTRQDTQSGDEDTQSGVASQSHQHHQSGADSPETAHLDHSGGLERNCARCDKEYGGIGMPLCPDCAQSQRDIGQEVLDSVKEMKAVQSAQKKDDGI